MVEKVMMVGMIIVGENSALVGGEKRVQTPFADAGGKQQQPSR